MMKKIVCAFLLNSFSKKLYLLHGFMTCSSLVSPPSLFLSSDKRWEATLSRNDEAQAKTSKEEEEEGPQRAAETCVGVRALLQRHTGSHQRPKPKCHLRGCLQDRRFHVGQLGRRAEAGKKMLRKAGVSNRCGVLELSVNYLYAILRKSCRAEPKQFNILFFFIL